MILSFLVIDVSQDSGDYFDWYPGWEMRVRFLLAPIDSFLVSYCLSQGVGMEKSAPFLIESYFYLRFDTCYLKQLVATAVGEIYRANLTLRSI
jgi:hypothetical protein